MRTRLILGTLSAWVALGALPATAMSEGDAHRPPTQSEPRFELSNQEQEGLRHDLDRARREFYRDPNAQRPVPASHNRQEGLNRPNELPLPAGGR